MGYNGGMEKRIRFDITDPKGFIAEERTGDGPWVRNEAMTEKASAERIGSLMDRAHAGTIRWLMGREAMEREQFGLMLNELLELQREADHEQERGSPARAKELLGEIAAARTKIVDAVCGPA
jgi:hypothetical protein